MIAVIKESIWVTNMGLLRSVNRSDICSERYALMLWIVVKISPSNFLDIQLDHFVSE